MKEALHAGALGYLLKTSAPEDLPCAIRAVLGGRLYLCEEARQIALENHRETLTSAGVPRPRLSARELEVLRLIAEGLRTKEVAAKLGVGLRTAETFRQRLLRKVGWSGTTELVRYAIREGIVSP